jgi:hypothetical protein
MKTSLRRHKRHTGCDPIMDSDGANARQTGLRGT